MRDSNYKSVSNNKAAVTITTSLYDRRALDVTSDKPLVNSLNHLTYLVSSSAKVRETLSNDGGIERLIEILHECHNLTFNLVDNIFNSEKKLLTAWKWTLAFQCLVLIGTRGTEKIRQKVVRAGMLPIIATVLDNYLTLYERTFTHANIRPNSNLSQFIQHNSNQNTDFTNVENTENTNPQLQRPIQAHLQAHSQLQTHVRNQMQQQPQQDQFSDQLQQTPFAFGGNPTRPVDSSPSTANTSFMEMGGNNVNPNTLQQANTGNPLGNTNEIDNLNQASEGFTNNNNNHGDFNNDHSNDVQNINNNNVNLNQLNNNSTSTFLNQIDSFSNSTLSTNTIADAVTVSSMSNNLDNVGSNDNNQAPNFFNNNRSDNLTSDDYDSLSVDQLFKLVRVNSTLGSQSSNNDNGCTNKSLANNDIKRRYLIVNIIKKLREEKEDDLLDDKFINESDFEMDNGLQFLSDMYLQEDRCTHVGNLVNSKSAPRSFTETGVVIPRDDDIVWSLQLLAYISKYPHLKEVLQNTHLIIDMSIRDKRLKLFVEKQMKTKLKKKLAIKARPTITPKSRKSKLPSQADHNSHNSKHTHNHKKESSSSNTESFNSNGVRSNNTYLERFNLSASNSPQMLNDINSIQNDDFTLDQDKFDLCNNKPDDDGLIEDAEAEDDEEFDTEDEDEKDNNIHDICEDCDDDEYITNLTGIHLKSESEESSTYLSKLYDSIIDAESIENDLTREITLFQISDKINRSVEIECKKLSNTIISKRLEQKQYLTEKWNYDDYKTFDVDEDLYGLSPREDNDYDDSLVEYKKVNLFPMVEKFTFLSGTDMYYWSGVIMRNSCRRNDFRGGVRQCGNLECGKWEKFAREFLKCRRCKRTKYCSRDCQMRAWHCHRNWCIPSNSSNTATTAASSSNANFEGNSTSVNEDETVATNGGVGGDNNNSPVSQAQVNHLQTYEDD